MPLPPPLPPLVCLVACDTDSCLRQVILAGGWWRTGEEEELSSNQTHEFEIFWERWHCVAFVVSNGAKNSPRVVVAAADDYGLMRHRRRCRWFPFGQLPTPVPRLQLGESLPLYAKLFVIIALRPENETMPAQLFLEQPPQTYQCFNCTPTSLPSSVALLSLRSTRLILIYLCVCAIFGKKQNGECNRLTPIKLYRWGVQLRTTMRKRNSRWVEDRDPSETV